MEFLPLILLVVVFYFLLIRPQQKQRREVAQVQQSVAPGARVMTGAGLIATVVSVEDDEVVLEVAPGITNRYVRRAIMRVIPDASGEAAPDIKPMTQPADEPARDDAPGTQS
ncbi:MAG: preprotein translocase subunit YajC [Jiangellaceae bacterium]